ncbi:hypothetical protein [Paenibacillus odorifer]|uniref:hypothetical protein n=1 Tax=Paenibacillus TaxID=44249 RepID=UPI00096E983C|nr:hypothetical protein [Paenibacillus odorifer]OMC96026.1 hypothetical protein BJP46_28150 [Paenibacillus odorifer]
MDVKWNEYSENYNWIRNLLSMPDILTISEYNEFVSEIEKCPLLIAQWVGFEEIRIFPTERPLGIVPFIPNMNYPPIIKTFIVPFSEQTDVRNFPSLNEYGLRTLISSNNIHCFITNIPNSNAWGKCVYFPDLRDLERLIYSNERVPIEEITSGLKMGDQLAQELSEAKMCKDINLPIATISTLSIAMETACKIVLEHSEIEYSRAKDGFNDLLNKLLKHNLLSGKSHASALALKGYRNSITHGHQGMATENKANVFYMCGYELIEEILQSIKHEGDS